MIFRYFRNGSQIFLLVFLFAALIPPMEVFAQDYVLAGPSWNKKNLTWSLATSDVGGPFSEFITEGSEFDKTLRQAFGQWEKSSQLTFTKVPDSSSVDIRLGWDSSFLLDPSHPQLNLATVDSRVDASNHFLPGTTIRFLLSRDYPWITEFEPRLDGYRWNFLAIALHYIGHAIGLAHYNNSTAIMNTRHETLKSLTVHDIRGAAALYGAERTQPNAGPKVKLKSSSPIYIPAGQSVNVLAFFTAEDPESDPILGFYIEQQLAVPLPPPTGYVGGQLLLNGQPFLKVSPNFRWRPDGPYAGWAYLDTGDVDKVTFKAGSDGATEVFVVRAYDGMTWGESLSFRVGSGAAPH